MGTTPKNDFSRNVMLPDTTEPGARQETIRVSFPCVHGAARGQLVKISCFQADELKGPIKVVAGIDDESARRVIGATRCMETDDRAAVGVITFFSNPLFGGESYGLALAIADKMTRLGHSRKWTEIYATGAIPADGCGAVEAIREFDSKLDLIIEQGKPGSLFVFPAGNYSDCPERIKEKLTLLKEKGIQWQAVCHLRELEGLLWNTTGKNNGNGMLQGIYHKLSKKPKNLLTNTVFTQKYFISVLIGLAVLIAITCFTWNPQRLGPTVSQEMAQHFPEKIRQQETQTVAEMPDNTVGKKEENTKNKKKNHSSVLESGSIDVSAY